MKINKLIGTFTLLCLTAPALFGQALPEQPPLDDKAALKKEAVAFLRETMADVGNQRAPDAAEVESFMLVEALVLDREHGLLELVGNVLEPDRDPEVVQLGVHRPQGDRHLHLGDPAFHGPGVHLGDQAGFG